MNDTVTVTGLVIGAMPMGEYDKRLLLLTRERGKLSAFAKGSRKPNSALVGATRLFSLGSFELYEGRTSYTVRSAEVREHFEYLAADPEALCYASYFAELADYYSRENLEAGETVKLLSYALLALKNPAMPQQLVRAVYELKLMMQEGEYSETPGTETDGTVLYTWGFVLETPPEKLFRFTLRPESLERFAQAVAQLREQYIDRHFKSLEILRELQLPQEG